MLRSVKEIKGFSIQATDGEIGKAEEFYFDDHSWTIRYLIVDTGNWLVSRKVLISPESLHKPDWENKIFPINLTKKQIEDSPTIDSEKPVSRKHEIEMMQYYGWPNYWTGVGGPVIGAIPPIHYYEPDKVKEELKNMAEQEEDEKNKNLRSSSEVINYTIQAKDDSIGHVEDFIFDDETWQIRYMIIDTKNFLPGKKVIIALSWIKNIEWTELKVHVDHTKEEIKNSPEFDKEKLNREYENQLFDYYKRPKYW
jgi:uncharacterized protein YrrD